MSTIAAIVPDLHAGGAAATPACSYQTIAVEGPVDPLFGQYQLRLNDMNDAGLAVGHYFIVGKRPCTWSAESGFKAIPMPFGVSEASADRINNNGWILVNGQAIQGARGWVLIPYEDGQGDTAYAWIEMVPVSFPMSGANAINDLNQVVGVQSMGSPGDAMHPHGGFLWSPQTGRQDIVVEGWVSTHLTGINDLGVMCGNVSQGVQAGAGVVGVRCVVLDGRTTTVVEPPPPFGLSTCFGITNSGLLGGTMAQHFSEPPPILAQPFVYDVKRSTLELLPVPSGYLKSSGYAINEAGLVVGHSRVSNISPDYVPSLFWRGGAMAAPDLLAPPFDQEAKYGYAIIDDGTFITTTVNFPGLGLVHVPMETIGDLDCDGTIGPADLGILLYAWGSADEGADLDESGSVGGSDLGLLLANWSLP